jgi:hypothetical protein
MVQTDHQLVYVPCEWLSVPSFNDFASVVALFTSLGSLTLRSMLLLRQCPCPIRRLPSGLRAFIVQDSFNYQLVEWLLEHDPMPQLHTIVFRMADPNELFVINDVFRTLGPSLRRLELTIPY